MILFSECARMVYSKIPPTEEYAKSIEDLLLGTCATESGFKSRRQGGFTLNNDNGAWGIMQTEKGSVQMGIAQLKKDPELYANACKYLHEDLDLDIPASTMLRVIYGWDRLAILFARLHYFRVPGPIPSTHVLRAAYYKRYYNTNLGSGSVRKYLEDYAHFVCG